MVKIHAELDKMHEVAQKVNSVGYAINTDIHLSSVIKATHSVLADGFNYAMTSEAVGAPERYGHMYEWHRTGDPLARLWKHNLAGRGKTRHASFSFLPSRTIVPVKPEAADLGVREQHVFTWKAPILEYGLPVEISPKDSPVLVFFAYNFPGQPLIITTKTIEIARQGNALSWGAFTAAFIEWWSSPEADNIYQRKIVDPASNTIAKVVESEIRKTNVSKKTFTINPLARDHKLTRRLQSALMRVYRGTGSDVYE